MFIPVFCYACVASWKVCRREVCSEIVIVPLQSVDHVSSLRLNLTMLKRRTFKIVRLSQNRLR